MKRRGRARCASNYSSSGCPLPTCGVVYGGLVIVKGSLVRNFRSYEQLDSSVKWWSMKR